MKKLIKTIVFLGSLLLLLTSSSCDNDDIETGDHSFSCYINGQLFVPKGSTNLISTSPSNDGVFFLVYDDFFNVKSYNSDIFVYITIINQNTGKFDLNTSHGVYGLDDPNTINHAIISIGDKTYLSKENSGSITFTEVSDTNVAGAFEFTLYNENDETDIIKITKGRFND
jgi:hypothetical protein